MDPEHKELEYVKLWMEQSKLFWSRLQSLAAIQTGSYVAWWTVLDSEKNQGISFFIPILGVSLTGLIMAIMDRDAAYMETLKNDARESFPHTRRESGTGRLCGKFIGWTLLSSNLILFWLSKIILNPQ